MEANILVVGDVFAKAGRKALKHFLPILVDEYAIDFVIVNGENAAGGKGITPKICDEFFQWGVDVISSGNHARDKKEIDDYLKSKPTVLRPDNFPEHVPGSGVYIGRMPKKALAIAVVNVQGRVHMSKVACPFNKMKDILKEVKKEANIVIVDFHAEATSEKRAMGWFLNGEVSAVVGTHTHVPTADAEVLSKKTAYISDLGMTGPYESIIGLKVELGLQRFLNNDKKKFDASKKDARFSGAVIKVNDQGEALSIEQVIRKLPDEV